MHMGPLVWSIIFFTYMKSNGNSFSDKIFEYFVTNVFIIFILISAGFKL